MRAASEWNNRFQMGNELSSRVYWLINLRWIAVGCLAAIIAFTHVVIRKQLNYAALYLGCVALLILNGLYFCYFRRAKSANLKSPLAFVNCQISLDLFLLTFLIHFSGRLENPFIYFFVFHMIIASILLSKRAAYLQAMLALMLFGSIFAVSAIEHRALSLLGVYGAFIATILIVVYMTTAIVEKLRDREDDLQNANAELVSINKRLARKDVEKSL